MDDTRLATGIFLIVVVIAAITAHAGALAISSSDSVEVATKDSKDATTWAKLEDGSIGSVELAKPTAVKLTLTAEKEKVEPVVQVWPAADSLVVQANYAGGEVDVALVGKSRIEAYYSYGKSSTYPWGIYWCVNDVGGKPMLVYSEFSGRKVWYAPIGQKTVDTLTATLEKGELPGIEIIREAVGA
jgi:hypothetical protein